MSENMKILTTAIAILIFVASCSQTNIPTKLLITQDLDEEYLENTISLLADDSMGGRGVNSGGLAKAADFLAEEFENIGLQHPEGQNSYRQSFEFTGKGGPVMVDNIIGILPGKSLSNEIVLFTAHYDHIGHIDPVDGDSIANGANDNATGTAAILTLAKLFKDIDIHERTLMFIGFTVEESGLIGSYHFADQLSDPQKIVASFNMDMLGNVSPCGENLVYITGQSRSNMWDILQADLSGTPYQLCEEPYPENPLRLFYRSDNYPLALAGIPAHTFTTFHREDSLYHRVGDEVPTLKMNSIKTIVKTIAQSSVSIIKGEETPRLND